MNADGIVGQTGELLGHNLFEYSKNNPVNMQDNGGFRPDFSGTGHDSGDDLAVSFACMSGTNKYNYQHPKNKPKSKNWNYDFLGAAEGPAVSTALAIAALKTTTIMTTTRYWGDFPITDTLSENPYYGEFGYAFSAVTLCFSVHDNFSSGKYSKTEAWERTGIDVISTILILGLCASGGWAAVGLGLVIGVVAETAKGVIDYYDSKKYN